MRRLKHPDLTYCPYFMMIGACPKIRGTCSLPHIRTSPIFHPGNWVSDDRVSDDWVSDDVSSVSSSADATRESGSSSASEDTTRKRTRSTCRSERSRSKYHTKERTTQALLSIDAPTRRKKRRVRPPKRRKRRTRSRSFSPTFEVTTAPTFEVTLPSTPPSARSTEPR